MTEERRVVRRAVVRSDGGKRRMDRGKKNILETSMDSGKKHRAVERSMDIDGKRNERWYVGKKHYLPADPKEAGGGQASLDWLGTTRYCW